MHRVGVGLILVSVLATSTACGGAGAADLQTFADSASYALGMNIAASIKREGAEIAIPKLLAGISDAMEDRTPALTEAQLGELLPRLVRQASEARSTRRLGAAEENQRLGQSFLSENGRRAEVTTTESGLQYEVTREGTGPHPTAADVVRVHYRGTLIDGTEFDATDRNGEGVTFSVGEVIAGWTEGLQLMSVGSVYRFYIPSRLAYGEPGYPPNIGPNQTLVFEVELLGIE
jgi:FKBP-type peptidyl-prolyl cis-trans isomerase FklB